MFKQLQKNIWYCLIEAIITTAILLLQYSLVATYLSYHDFGIYSLGMLWSLVVVIASYGFGLPVVLSRELCQRDNQQSIINNVFFLQMLLGLVTLMIFLPIILLTDYFKDFRNFGFISFISGSLILAAPISMQGILSSQGRMDVIAKIRILAFALNLLAIFAIAHLDLGLSWIFASHLILVFVFASGFFNSAKKQIQLTLKSIELKELKFFLIQTSPVVLMSIASQIYGKADLIMLDKIRGKEDVAIYAAAYKILEYLLIISSALILAIFPDLMKSAHDLQSFKTLYKSSIKIVLLGLFPVAMLIAFFAHPILGAIYSDGYHIAGGTLQILMISGCLSFINSPSATLFIAQRKAATYLIATLLSLSLNVLLNLFFIPSYGYQGAATATLIAELFMLGFCLINLKKIFKSETANAEPS